MTEENTINLLFEDGILSGVEARAVHGNAICRISLLHEMLGNIFGSHRMNEGWFSRFDSGKELALNGGVQSVTYASRVLDVSRTRIINKTAVSIVLRVGRSVDFTSLDHSDVRSFLEDLASEGLGYHF